MRWARPLPLPRPETSEPVSTFVGYVDEQHWWEVAGGQLFKTSNAGQDWKGGGWVLRPGLYFAGLDVIDDQVAWALATKAEPLGLASTHPAVVDMAPHLVRSTDGGATWFEVPFPPTVVTVAG
jgi:photosystem II stability/assembly factor-like uncharacterized protein